MKKVCCLFLATVTLLIVAFVPSQALARPFHHNARVFIGVGPVFPWWWAPPVYPAYAPPVVVQQSPPVYVQPQAPAEQYWYYCENPKGYYPYVQQCSHSWLRVAPTP